MTAPKLTKAQREALAVLWEGFGRAGEPIATSTHTDQKGTPTVIHGGVAKTLAAIGLAKAAAFLPDDSEVTGAKMGSLFGFWRTKYRLTQKGVEFCADAGRAALKDGAK